MTITIDAEAYEAQSFNPTSVVYSGPAHTITNVDTLKLAALGPKPTTVFSGVARREAKFTRTMTLTDSLTPKHPAILTTDVSVPVGADPAAITEMVSDYALFVSSAEFLALVLSGSINT